jgi:hypothetical protein
VWPDFKGHNLLPFIFAVGRTVHFENIRADNAAGILVHDPSLVPFHAIKARNHNSKAEKWYFHFLCTPLILANHKMKEICGQAVIAGVPVNIRQNKAQRSQGLRPGFAPALDIKNIYP